MQNSSRIATEHTFISHDGQIIFYRHWGALNPLTATRSAVVLLHRGHEHSGRVSHLVDELEMPTSDFFAWDARGCGRTEGVRGYSPSFMTWVRDLADFIAHIQEKHAILIEQITVIAQSVAAVIAATWVHDYAPKIKALVLASPAFSIKLYIPFALKGICLAQKLNGQFFVTSYVKGRHLTQDGIRAKTYHEDPLITLPISSNVLLGLADTATRVVKDAGAIIIPTQVLISGADYVVHQTPQHQFYENLSSKLKERHLLNKFRHDTLGEKERGSAINLIKQFLTKVDNENSKVDLLQSDRYGYTFNEYQTLLRPKSPCWVKEINFALTRLSMKYIGAKLAKGIKIGLELGFDSGSSLDYIYKNKAQSVGENYLSWIGKFIDRGYLNAIGWKGIRLRKQNLETLIVKVINNLKEKQEKMVLMDIAAGHGRYILDAIEPYRESLEYMTLRDYSDINVKSGQAMIIERGLQNKAIFVNGNAFDETSLTAVEPKPNLAIVSGLYELFSDNRLLKDSLNGLYKALKNDGYLIYTNQPWHPQVELIARTLNNHQGEERWIMRRRTQAEMDQLIERAGFEKLEQLQDEWGIFTVSLARKKNDSYG